ncbi:BatA domain-containing protein [Spirosoma aerolatum]|uniref:BatA domain-containing protein n=1 Tax=Spirosoma aerolatum TaxID=1211326 RepID=UPI0009ACECDE|nr:BatA domain-containing protein [Spirosoma aerolatum]
MQFIEPVILWGTLAVVVPIAIHFWHQKQGKLLPWAATQWLLEKQQQQSRGLRLDNLLLLLVRCILLILLAVLLAQPILNWASKKPAITQIHLVQPNPTVADNFRFELAEALKKGERVIWANSTLEPIQADLKSSQSPGSFGPLTIQSAINQVNLSNTELHLYINNNQALADVPAIVVPSRFKLHSIGDSSTQPRPYIVVKNGRRLFLNRAGQLVSSPLLDPALKFQAEPTHTGPIHTLVAFKNVREQQTVKASLAALTDVYGLDLLVEEKSVPNQLYDWVLTDQLPANPSLKTLYVVSGTVQHPTTDNVITTDETLTPQTSGRVETGQLPEWLGELLIRHYGLASFTQPLSQQELNALFVPSAKPKTEQQAGLQNALFLLVLVIIGVERWMALTKNA